MDQDQVQSQQQGSIETWAIVEIFGHQKLAGFVRSVGFGNAAMLRVDVPALEEKREKGKRWTVDGEVDAEKVYAAVPAYTKFLGIGSIFSITPCTEETAKAMAERIGRQTYHVLDATPMLPAPASVVGGNVEENDDGPELDEDDPDGERYRHR